MGTILPCQEKIFKRLESVFSRLLTSSQFSFGLNCRSYRREVQDESLLFVPGAASKTILDGDLIQRFITLSRTAQREIVQFVGTAVRPVFGDLLVAGSELFNKI